MKTFLVIAVFLSGCAGSQDRIREIGGRAFYQGEGASALVLDGALRYMCRSVRIGPAEDRFDTDEERSCRAVICANPELPE